MTRDNKLRNIAAESTRGDDSLESAELLLEAGKHADAVSRAYYAAFHYARALLLTQAEEPRTHGGVERLLQRDFVQSGTLDPAIGKLFSRLQKFRQDADYTAEFVFTREGAADEVSAAKTFVGAARTILDRGGWLKAAPGRG
jgi:uncharacterized protein (UPF0332 family)